MNIRGKPTISVQSGVRRHSQKILKNTLPAKINKERKRKMKKSLLLATMGILVLGLGFGVAYAHMGSGMMGPGYGYGPAPQQNYNYVPYCGNYSGSGYGMGPGMMGPGMMGPGYGYGYGPRYGYGQQYQQPSKPLSENQARQEVENYLSSTRNPNLKMGKIEDKGNDYEVNIETKDGSLVNKLLVNKDTGWMRSAY
jgi:hypothetical protein